jgi:hypothetical protein
MNYHLNEMDLEQLRQALRLENTRIEGVNDARFQTRCTSVLCGTMGVMAFGVAAGIFGMPLAEATSLPWVSGLAVCVLFFWKNSPKPHLHPTSRDEENEIRSILGRLYAERKRAREYQEMVRETGHPDMKP